MRVVGSIDEVFREINSNEQIGITIGNFDGVHVGHQKLLSEVYEECRDLNLKFTLLTFIPHPKIILVPNLDKSYLINTYHERRDLLKKMNLIDYMVELNFTRDFSLLSPQDFINRYILQNDNGNRVKKLFFGHDFSFGANKKGNIDHIKSMFPCLDITEHKMFVKENTIHSSISSISSTVIRDLISNGKIAEAEELLGRKYFISGRVIKSKGIGRTLGFPTANIDFFEHLITPSRGVYATKTQINNKIYNSITNVGFNPTTDRKDDNIVKIETHILDFNSDIYGEKIIVYFEKRIRNEEKFSSLEELKKQITSDVNLVRNFFSMENKNNAKDPY